MSVDLEKLESRVLALEKKVKVILEQQSEAITQGRNPFAIYTRQLQIDEELTKLISAVGVVQSQFREDNKTKIENFTDEQLKTMYMATGLTLKEIKNELGINFKDKGEITEQRVFDLIHGKNKDVQMRSFIGKHLRKNVK